MASESESELEETGERKQDGESIECNETCLVITEFENFSRCYIHSVYDSTVFFSLNFLLRSVRLTIVATRSSRLHFIYIHFFFGIVYNNLNTHSHIASPHFACKHRVMFQNKKKKKKTENEKKKIHDRATHSRTYNVNVYRHINFH